MGFIFFAILFFASVPEVTCIRHSGRDPEAGQNVFLQYNPEYQYSNQHHQVIHKYFLSLRYLLLSIDVYLRILLFDMLFFAAMHQKIEDRDGDLRQCCRGYFTTHQGDGQPLEDRIKEDDETADNYCCGC